MPYKDKNKQKEYYELHKEELRGCRKEYYEKNKNKINEQRREKYTKSDRYVKSKQYQAKYPDKVKQWSRNSWIRKKFGLEPGDYNIMFNAQKGLCAICGLPEKHKYKGRLIKLAVDHNHSTGKIRGLLCSECNIAIGNLKVDSFGILNLQTAIKYIEETDNEMSRVQ